MKYTFRISFFLKKSTVRKNGKSPIIARITLNGEKVEFSTKLGIAASQWNTDIGEVKGNSYEAVTLNNDLISIRMTLYTYYRNLSEKCEIITADKLRKMYTQTETYPQTLLTLFRKHNDDELKLVGYGRVIDTYKNFHVARHSFSTSIMLDHGVSMETLSRVLGHSNIKTTQIYAQVTNKKVSYEMNVLAKKLKLSY